ncbi:MAG: Gfo/Idh/MocA family oxidoreductase [Planctomycetota bacterium]
MAALGEQLRFGIAGMGLMGRGYFRILREHEGVCVTAVCDSDPDRLRPEWYHAAHEGTASSNDDDRVLGLGGQSFAGTRAAVRALASFYELAACPDVNVVAITLPTALHADAAVAALENGKHVICEKPMALSTADCDRMVAAARANGTVLMIEQCVRFFPQYELIKQYVDEGRVGRVRHASLVRLSSPPTHSKDDWMLDSRQSGGAICDLHIHDVDFAQHLLGTPETIQARGCVGPSGGIDHVVATYTYANGAYAVLEGGWSLHAPFPFDMAITVRGETGTMHWTASKGSAVLLYRGGSEPVVLECSNEGGTRRLIRYFLEELRAGGGLERCTAESARASMALAELEVEAVRTGATISVREVAGMGSRRPGCASAVSRRH